MSDRIDRHAGFSTGLSRPVWLALLLIAIAYFALRGPVRAVFDSGDFLTVFCAARCWVHGMNPYAVSDLMASGHAAGAPVSEEHFRVVPSFYFPPAYPLLAPFAVLPWGIAKLLWLLCSLGLTFIAGAAVVWMTKASAMASWTALLACAPVHTGLSKGQPSVPVCAFIILSLALPNPYAAGLLLGVALCIKPQLAFGFVLLAFGLREWRKLAALSLTVVVIGGIGVLRLHPAALQTLQSNIRQVSSPSGLISGSGMNPARFQLITVDTLIPTKLHSTIAIAALSTLIAAISATAVWRCLRSPPIATAVVAAATMLVGYHRFYDAQLLWLVIPAIPLLKNRWLSVALIAGYCVFLVPGQTMIAKLWNPPGGGDALAFLLQSHEVLASIAIWAILISAALIPTSWSAVPRLEPLQPEAPA